MEEKKRKSYSYGMKENKYSKALLIADIDIEVFMD